jgi:hypothetical protein
MPHFVDYLPAIVFFAALCGVAWYLKVKGLQDPRAMVAKAPRVTGMIFVLLAGLLFSIGFALEYRDAVERGHFFILETMLFLVPAFVISGAILLALGPRGRRIVPIGPDVHRLTNTQWTFMVFLLSICLGVFFGFPKLMETLGWQVHRFP